MSTPLAPQTAPRDTETPGPTRSSVMVQKYNGREPGDGEPDETVVHVIWQRADGTVITDETEIAELELKLVERYREIEESEHGE